jgi:hypothetical protein
MQRTGFQDHPVRSNRINVVANEALVREIADDGRIEVPARRQAGHQSTTDSFDNEKTPISPGILFYLCDPPLVNPTYRRRVNQICTDLVSTPDLYMLYAT